MSVEEMQPFSHNFEWTRLKVEHDLTDIFEAALERLGGDTPENYTVVLCAMHTATSLALMSLTTHAMPVTTSEWVKDRHKAMTDQALEISRLYFDAINDAEIRH